MTTTASAPFQLLDAKTGTEARLAMQSLWLTGRVMPVGARLMVRHVFRSGESRPLEVVYAFALPRDAALRRFRINGEGFSVRSELQPAADALKAYEKGLAEGHLATLARQHGDGVVNLSVGNIRPGETVSVCLEILAGVEARDGGFRFRFPFTLAPSYHPRARAAEAAPGVGEMELPEDEFGDVLLPRWAADAAGLHEVGFDLAVEVPGGAAEIASPSHPLRVSRNRVSLAVAADVPDRDLVLDAGVPEKGGILTGIDRNGKGRFAAVVPSTRFGAAPDGARRVVIVLDRSGSMAGTPIAQARKSIAACLGALDASDCFGLVAFDDRTEAFRPALAEAGIDERRQAREFLDRIDARGGTELAKALEHAFRLLGAEGGDALVLTDGQVFGTGEILALARRTGMRIHCLGIGSASQDRFLALLARETGGVSRFLTARERVDMAAVELFAATGRPLASPLAVTGAVVAPAPSASVFSGTPVVLFGETPGAGPARLAFSWPGGEFAVDFTVEPGAAGETLRLLQGARLLTDLEARIADSKREEQRITAQLEALGREFGLASRAMALVAVAERAGDRPGDVPKTVVVPVGMPRDVEFGAYFGGAPAGRPGVMACFAAPAPPSTPTITSRAMRRSMRASAAPPVEAYGELAAKLTSGPPSGENDAILELAARIEPDGGMPGPDLETRAASTSAALLAFLAEGHTTSSGAFRQHVRRLAGFLRNTPFPPRLQTMVEAVLELIAAGRPVAGPWLFCGANPEQFWHELQKLAP